MGRESLGGRRSSNQGTMPANCGAAEEDLMQRCCTGGRRDCGKGLRQRDVILGKLH